jgi:hypothetical protein
LIIGKEKPKKNIKSLFQRFNREHHATPPPPPTTFKVELSVHEEKALAVLFFFKLGSWICIVFKNKQKLF